MAKFTAKQSRFIEAYLQCWNATEAARRAGYRGSESTLASVGYENLRKPQIAEEIARHLTADVMGAEEVLSRLADHARADMGPYLRYDERGQIWIDIEQMRVDGLTHLIKKVRQGKGGLQVFELHDAQSALALLAKHHRLLDGEHDMTIMHKLDDDVKDILKRKLDSLAAANTAEQHDRQSNAETGEEPSA